MNRALFVLLLIFSANIQADQYVNGYTRSNGTVVNGYYRTDANNNRNDNYSSQLGGLRGGSSNFQATPQGYMPTAPKTEAIGDPSTYVIRKSQQRY